MFKLEESRFDITNVSAALTCPLLKGFMHYAELGATIDSNSNERSNVIGVPLGHTFRTINRINPKGDLIFGNVILE